MRKPIVFIVPALLIFMLAVYTSVTTAKAPRVVARPGRIAEQVAARGIVTPRDGIAEVRAQAGGEVLRVFVRAGDRVQRGQMLAELDADPARHELERREAEVSAATASLHVLSGGASFEERQALSAELEAMGHDYDLARKRLAQEEALYREHSLPQRALSEATHAEAVARARVKAVEHRLRDASRGGRPAELRRGRARLLASQATAALARYEVEHRRLLSPRDGIVLTRLVDPGDTIPPAVDVTAFEIADPSAIELMFEVEEANAAEVMAGLSVTVRQPDGSVLGLARITRVAGNITKRAIDIEDARVRATGGVLRLWADFTERTPGLSSYVGQRLEGIIKLRDKPAKLVLPRQAVQVRDGRSLVEVMSTLGTSERAVRMLGMDDRWISVEGLEPGTEVMVR